MIVLLAIMLTLTAAEIGLLFVAVKAATRFGVKPTVAGLVAGLALGLVLGWEAASVYETSLFNPAGLVIGGEVYFRAIRTFGDPSSSNAHDTIPWLLRIPQVHVVVSVALWAAVGAACGWWINRRERAAPADWPPSLVT